MFGNRIRELRKKKGLTQEELGKKVNVTKVSISGYENGNRTPDTETLQKLADVLETNTEYILGRTDNPTGLTEKEEKDIAKRLEQIRNEIEHTDGLSFDGEPMSEEAVESLMEAMEHIVRQTKRINKKYIPKKHREDNKE